jgi:hypothetical protein
MQRAKTLCTLARVKRIASVSQTGPTPSDVLRLVQDDTAALRLRAESTRLPIAPIPGSPFAARTVRILA